jgi:hypothetical protein
MLQALKAKKQAIREIREAEIEAKRKAAINAIEKASIQLQMKHDMNIAMLDAELQMAKDRLKD